MEFPTISRFSAAMLNSLNREAARRHPNGPDNIHSWHRNLGNGTKLGGKTTPNAQIAICQYRRCGVLDSLNREAACRHPHGNGIHGSRNLGNGTKPEGMKVAAHPGMPIEPAIQVPNTAWPLATTLRTCTPATSQTRLRCKRARRRSSFMRARRTSRGLVSSTKSRSTAHSKTLLSWLQ